MDTANYNVVVSVRERGYRAAAKVLKEYGKVSRTDFYNVLLMQVDAIDTFLEQLLARIAADPDFGNQLGHVIPAFSTFTFQSPEDFETKTKQALAPFTGSLAGKTFHVRMRRRGFKGRLSSQDEERLLDHYLMEQLASKGQSAHIGFSDPDIIIAIETVGQWAGVSSWTRDDLKRYPFLTLD
jgi:adenylyl- and sulfurtransferase ThiI